MQQNIKYNEKKKRMTVEEVIEKVTNCYQHNTIHTATSSVKLNVTTNSILKPFTHHKADICAVKTKNVIIRANKKKHTGLLSLIKSLVAFL